jgi:hypothetical protein
LDQSTFWYEVEQYATFLHRLHLFSCILLTKQEAHKESEENLTNRGLSPMTSLREISLQGREERTLSDISQQSKEVFSV